MYSFKPDWLLTVEDGGGGGQKLTNGQTYLLEPF